MRYKYDVLNGESGFYNGLSYADGEVKICRKS